MKKLHILFAIFAVVLAISCEGFLDVKPSNSASAETYITSVTDAKIMINGVMSRMTSSLYYGRNFIMYGDAKEETLRFAPREGVWTSYIRLTTPPPPTHTPATGHTYTTAWPS